MKVFNTIGHFFANAVKKLLVAAPKVIAALPKIEAGLEVVEASKTKVEAISSLVPTYGPLLVTGEDAAYMVIGEGIAVFHALGDAAAAKFAGLGFDSKVIDTLKAVANDPSIKTAAKLI
jgi:hypothetical protein